MANNFFCEQGEKAMMSTTSSYLSTMYVSQSEVDSIIIGELTIWPHEEEFDDEEYARKVLRLVFSVAYFVLFIFGTVGNGIVIVMIINVMTAMRRSQCRSNSRRINPSSTKHVFIYILGLSIVDLLVIIHLPFLIADLLYGQWLFGKVMCKLYWFGECVNKLLSSFIMTVLSWDRYLAVCSPVKSFRIRSNAVACFVLFLCSALATLLLLPVLLNATVVHLSILTGQPFVQNGQSVGKSYEFEEGTTVTKCMFDGTNSFFMFYTFGCGFFLPALLITYFYTRVTANPVLYALINRELRQQHMQAMLKRRRSLSNATNIALDFIGKHSHGSLHPFCTDGNLSSNHSLFSGLTAPLRHMSESFDNLNNRSAARKRAGTITANLLSSTPLRSTSFGDEAESCAEQLCLVDGTCTYSNENSSLRNDYHKDLPSDGNEEKLENEKRRNLLGSECDDSSFAIRFEATDALL
ncbi:unnamed protein product [Toxocara canis]|uniref:G_PROTEIN_RECEP_F1_2 domain-containing protein n=1 Tax=Toxocara canis TaxID=6265 RepID=A0A183UMS9_TOXCA|nr:unnamed protein product [Toxocara canis]